MNDEILNSLKFSEIIQDARDNCGIELTLSTFKLSTCHLETKQTLTISFRDYCSPGGKLLTEKFSNLLKVDGPFVDDLLGSKSYEPLLDIDYFLNMVLKNVLMITNFDTKTNFFLELLGWSYLLQHLNKHP